MKCRNRIFARLPKFPIPRKFVKKIYWGGRSTDFFYFRGLATPSIEIFASENNTLCICSVWISSTDAKAFFEQQRISSNRVFYFRKRLKAFVWGKKNHPEKSSEILKWKINAFKAVSYESVIEDFLRTRVHCTRASYT